MRPKLTSSPFVVLLAVLLSCQPSSGKRKAEEGEATATSSIAETVNGARSLELAGPLVSVPPFTSITMPTWSWQSSGQGTGSFVVALDDNADTDKMIQTTETSFTPDEALSEGLHTLYVAEFDSNGLLSEWTEISTRIIGALTIANSLVYLSKDLVGKDDSSPLSVTVRLLDTGGQSISGFTPTLQVPVGAAIVNQNCTETNGQGYAYCKAALIPTSSGTIDVGVSDEFELTTSLVIRNVHYGHQFATCGMDRDGDGVTGEPEDCSICNGSVGLAGDQIYVDSVSGNDSNNGSPTSPFQTIAAAMGSAAYDGIGDGVADTICLSGTFLETVTLSQSGVDEVGTDFHGSKIPKRPVTFMGWDKDQDGIYPPLDPDDTAVIDGEDTRLWAFDNTAQTDVVEIAHLSIRNFTSTGSSGVLDNRSGLLNKYFYLHDLHIENINPNQTYSANRCVYCGGGEHNQYLVLYNNFIENVGGAVVVTESNTDKFQSDSLFKNNKVVWLIDGTDHIYTYRTEGHTGISIENNYIIADKLNVNFGGAIIELGSCSQDINIKKNIFKGVGLALRISPAGGCGIGQDIVNNIVFESNIVEAGGAGLDAIILYTQAVVTDETNAIGRVDLLNNFIYTIPTMPIDSPFWIYTAHDNGPTPHPGDIRLYGNTVRGNFSKGFIFNRHDAIGGTPAGIENIDLRNNITDISGSTNSLQVGYNATNFSMHGNVFMSDKLPNQAFDWTGAHPSLTAFIAEADDYSPPGGFTTNTEICTPTFSGTSSLIPYDVESPTVQTGSCTIGAGVDISAELPADFEGDLRSGAKATDAGADVAP